MKGSTVRIENVSKSFGHFLALNEVSLHIAGGEFFSLLGPSGCGKTTLLRIIAGLEEPVSGAVYFDDQEVTGLAANQRHTNTVFQNYALFPHLSVFENVAFPLRLKRKTDLKVRQQVAEYLALVRLNGQEHKKPAQLSGGQQQRVAIARALINQPRILLLDEPLSALDAKLRQQLLIELDAIHRQVGITFIYVTHDQQEALGISDRVAVMSQGRILQVGTPRAIYEQPADAFTARFIGETNLWEGTVVAADAAGVTVRTDGGGEVRFDPGREVRVGQQITVGVRPEKVRVDGSRPPAGEVKAFVWTGMVDEIIYSGFHSRVFIRTDQAVVLQSIRTGGDQVRRERSGDQRVYCWCDRVDVRLIEVKGQ